MIDNIFGNQIEFDNSLGKHREKRIGIHHFNQIDPPDPLPDQPIEIRCTTGGPMPFESIYCFFTTDGSDPGNTEANVIELSQVSSVWDDLDWSYVRNWRITLPPSASGTMIRYKIAGRVVGSNHWVYADNQADTSQAGTEFTIYVDNDSTPVWAHKAIVYHIFVDRFYPGDGKRWNETNSLLDFFGGTIRGVIDKLDYIQELGFNTIWLSPFFKTTSHHGYNASDYYSVEPRLGTNSDIKELINQAHRRGLRILLDFVANHWSKDHPTFQDAIRNPRSKYHDWYFWRHWPDDYVAYFDVKELPSVNLRPGPAREEMLNIAQFWLKEGFDGYRLDYASGPSFDFWPYFRRACRTVNPECWLFGEVVQDAESQRVFAGRLDGTLDFLLARSLRETFAFGRMTLAELEAFLKGHEAYFPPGFNRPSFLDNHDMSRFYYISGMEKKKLQLAALMLYTLENPPIIYYGTESGLSQDRPMQQGDRYVFEEARLPMDWENQDSELINFFTKLNELRRSHPVLVNGTRLLIHLDSENGTYGYIRKDGAETVLVLFNLSNSLREIKLPISGIPAKAIDHLNGLQVGIHSGAVEISLPARTGAFIS
ncbi:MAG TPA: alpha-amylase family glycosyl hydrolase [Prolixibacteraceae bacterium]